MRQIFKSDVVSIAFAVGETKVFKVDPKVQCLTFNRGEGGVECLPKPVYDELNNANSPLSSTAKTNVRALWKVDGNLKELECDLTKHDYREFVLVNAQANASSVMIERQFILI
ncbi:MAG: hypothetical protein U0X91_30765 [Spirosomataceae bacterium]